MNDRFSAKAPLVCHAESQGGNAERIDAGATLMGTGLLAVTYALKGSLIGLRIPPPRPPRRADGLWRHTCFELFIAEKGQPSYWEVNFSPSGEWAAYAFKSHRDGGAIEDDGLDPRIEMRSTAEGLELGASVRLDRLSLIQPEGLLRLGLAAVVEETDGTLSYWALTHPPGAPDFHHRDCFTLELALPGKSA